MIHVLLSQNETEMDMEIHMKMANMANMIGSKACAIYKYN